MVLLLKFKRGGYGTARDFKRNGGYGTAINYQLHLPHRFPNPVSRARFRRVHRYLGDTEPCAAPYADRQSALCRRSHAT